MSLTNPYWYDRADKNLFWQLLKKDDKYLTKDENNFVKQMMIQEKIAYDAQYD